VTTAATVSVPLIPFILVQILVLLVYALFPALSLWRPRTLQ
jgi:TRAP-type mannitol/chloroaromatic compound transport system permease large subunit